MTDFDKLSHEHRAAWKELISIQNSKEAIADKIKRIIHLFDTELLSHFRDEEDNVLTDDAMSREILDEHQQIYDLIDLMKADKAGDAEVMEFITILKGHIKKEDAYFGTIEKSKKSNGTILKFAIAIVVVIALIIVFYPSIKNELA